MAIGRNLNISPKQSIEICSYIRGRSVGQAVMILDDAITKKKAIPFHKYTNGLGHKPGIAAGRYPVKACTAIRRVIKSAEANAKNKGLSASDLKIVHIAVQTAPKQWHYGRQRRSVFKTAHIEVVVAEVKGTVKKTAPKKDVKEKDKQ